MYTITQYQSTFHSYDRINLQRRFVQPLSLCRLTGAPQTNKKPHVSAKESYISTNETCMSAKERICIGALLCHDLVDVLSVGRIIRHDGTHRILPI